MEVPGKFAGMAVCQVGLGPIENALPNCLYLYYVKKVSQVKKLRPFQDVRLRTCWCQRNTVCVQFDYVLNVSHYSMLARDAFSLSLVRNQEPKTLGLGQWSLAKYVCICTVHIISWME